eukprot:CAMPEP_0184340204 /NCGR_PEP_ID=MMETSP1089-20130417/8890_1 /TAXON_ID=38269 ORGANISM="Gloeochaete wittrockiana, Strain SAG46.84" /NCGR_SAMPLE_ID=MMETSP1089 /ASSEMBLY_ACC=CAM_ASM_000445 /LENGTH=646 /DNA_ID=CAMNT_0026667909 /DNA_START=38 /DNA_END=1975 /DNA_ORIENTATION=-
MDIAQLVNEATSDMLIRQDYELNLRIVDFLNRNPPMVPHFFQVLHVRLQNSEPEIVMRALELLETTMQNCYFVVAHANNSPVQRMLVNLVETKKDVRIADKIRSLIRCWGEGLSREPSLPNFSITYQHFLKKSLPFPPKSPDMPPFQLPAKPSQGMAPMASRPVPFPMPSATAVYRPTSPSPSDSAHLSKSPVASAQVMMAKRDSFFSGLAERQNMIEILLETLYAFDPAYPDRDQKTLIDELLSQCQDMQRKVTKLLEDANPQVMSDEQMVSSLLAYNDSMQAVDSAISDVKRGCRPSRPIVSGLVFDEKIYDDALEAEYQLSKSSGSSSLSSGLSSLHLSNSNDFFDFEPTDLLPPAPNKTVKQRKLDSDISSTSFESLPGISPSTSFTSSSSAVPAVPSSLAAVSSSSSFSSVPAPAPAPAGDLDDFDQMFDALAHRKSAAPSPAPSPAPGAGSLLSQFAVDPKPIVTPSPLLSTGSSEALFSGTLSSHSQLNQVLHSTPLQPITIAPSPVPTSLPFTLQPLPLQPTPVAAPVPVPAVSTLPFTLQPMVGAPIQPQVHTQPQFMIGVPSVAPIQSAPISASPASSSFLSSLVSNNPAPAPAPTSVPFQSPFVPVIGSAPAPAPAGFDLMSLLSAPAPAPAQQQ